ncbi:hypothetical protein CKO51_05320 [Rhodopirellula sp. SM50]|nr:hypothetical protein [Rhodopirellula sp. SM50]PAY20476.1 hypothetical protein CKO51_05320 [Rhodopirellula sp. SM50]
MSTYLRNSIARRQFLGTFAGASALAMSGQTIRAQDSLTRDPISESTARLNPKIHQSREVALGILKPSKAEIDRGMKLHAESIVFDAYGFGPRAAIDGDALAAAIEAGASAIEIKDIRKVIGGNVMRVIDASLS